MTRLPPSASVTAAPVATSHLPISDFNTTKDDTRLLLRGIHRPTLPAFGDGLPSAVARRARTSAASPMARRTGSPGLLRPAHHPSIITAMRRALAVPNLDLS